MRGAPGRGGKVAGGAAILSADLRLVHGSIRWVGALACTFTTWTFFCVFVLLQ